ncbi:hypothetical protein PsorP6_008843 [Peronosclerospora sorghi]|uniref:Uncharacterized protein n=1 Tax=Peronosclerospora sorghi TaxID=230839 RepID=A0ACC0W0U2_9STRA|nr:hypothetical protein PsorP6_008843 [Peronosclerospora sorghi]
MKWGALLIAAVVATVEVQSKEDLPPDAQLRIGVKYRPKECIMKSEPGDTLSMHYTGTLRNGGAKFDSSLDRDQPFEFPLGKGRVIKVISAVRVELTLYIGELSIGLGSRRRLTIPSDLAYGDHGSPPKIPGKATLVFDVELLDIKRKNEEL